MHVANVRVRNYKGFADSGEVELAPGFNVVVGRNDAGKSAFLEAVSLSFEEQPHRSSATAPSPLIAPFGPSTVDAVLALGSNDAREMALAQADWRSDVDDWSSFEAGLQSGATLRSRWANGGIAEARFEGSRASNAVGSRMGYRNALHPLDIRFEQVGLVGGSSDAAMDLCSLIKARIYAFKAERLTLGEASIGARSELMTNASNLAEVLNQLSTSNPARYRNLIEAIQAVFPHITWIDSSHHVSNSFRIRVWTEPVEEQRSDLAIALAQSGTGIGQVVAMLYVLMTAQTSRVIVIDEPQSFLHPGAVRALFEIFREHPRHQYIVSSHSAAVLGIASEARVIQISRSSAGSKVAAVDMRKQDEVRASLADVGARLSDVFGADAILWVEGETEEVCFPEIVHLVGKVRLGATQIIGVIDTGFFGHKDVRRATRIYEKLAKGRALLPPAVGFIFDREGTTDRQREDITRESRGLVHWLPRRMYENYLLRPAAIARLLVELGATADAGIVEAWLMKTGVKPYTREAVEVWSDPWLQNVDGARALSDIFSDLSGATLEYRKAEHGLRLTRLIANDDPAALSELADFIAEAADHALA